MKYLALVFLFFLSINAIAQSCTDLACDRQIVKEILEFNGLPATEADIDSKIFNSPTRNDRVYILGFSNYSTFALPPAVGRLSALENFNVMYMEELSALPAELGQATNLKNFSLYGSHIGATNADPLPMALATLDNLQSVDFGSNNLSSDQLSVIYEWDSLLSLRLNGNNITTVGPGIANLTNLSLLELGYNPLTSIPPEMAGLTNLTSVTFDATQVPELPSFVFTWTNLTRLRVNGAELTSLSPAIGNLTKLTHLAIGYNNLTVLPDEITQLTNLVDLGAGGNQLTALPNDIGNLVKLVNLDLYSNNLATVPLSITNLNPNNYPYPGPGVSGPVFRVDLRGNDFCKEELPQAIIDWLNGFSEHQAVGVCPNTAPTAIIDVELNAEVGTAVLLNGAQSSDNEGHTLSFTWTLIAPALSLASLDDSSSSTPSFTPDVAGDYQVSLVVTEEWGLSSAEANVTIVAIEVEEECIDGHVTGDLTTDGEAFFNNSINVVGSSNLSGGLSVAGDTVLAGAVALDGDVTSTGNLQVNGSVSLGSHVDVSGPLAVNNNLAVTGNSTFDNSASFNSGVAVTGSLTINGQDLEQELAKPLHERSSKYFFSVIDFGAVNDGSVDSGGAFRDALAAAAAVNGGVVLVPAGTFLLSGHIDIPANTSLIGVSQRGTTLLYQTSNSGSLFTMQNNASLKQLSIYHPDAWITDSLNQSSVHIQAPNVTIREVWFANANVAVGVINAQNVSLSNVEISPFNIGVSATHSEIKLSNVKFSAEVYGRFADLSAGTSTGETVLEKIQNANIFYSAESQVLLDDVVNIDSTENIMSSANSVGSTARTIIRNSKLNCGLWFRNNEQVQITDSSFAAININQVATINVSGSIIRGGHSHPYFDAGMLQIWTSGKVNVSGNQILDWPNSTNAVAASQGWITFSGNTFSSSAATVSHFYLTEQANVNVVGNNFLQEPTWSGFSKNSGVLFQFSSNLHPGVIITGGYNNAR